MIGTAIIGTMIGRSRASFMRAWTLLGCLASAAALAFLSIGAFAGTGFPLHGSVFALGTANGMFAVAAIGSMMALASAGDNPQEGTRMGVWGAAQAVAFGIGGLMGAVGIDIARSLIGDLSTSFALVFALEALTFVAAGILALRVGKSDADERNLPFMPAEQFAAE
jgi:BCD family chlorophyll transporter-like MFS transporter